MLRARYLPRIVYRRSQRTLVPLAGRCLVQAGGGIDGFPRWLPGSNNRSSHERTTPHTTLPLRNAGPRSRTGAIFPELDRAIFFITQTVSRGMINHGQGGSIVTFGSMWAHQATAATPSPAYSLAKGGLHALTRSLAMELASYQIRVNAVVATPIYERFVPRDKIEETMRGFDGFHPLGRVGTADDVAATISVSSVLW